MPRPKVSEKSKDFKGSMKRLIKNLKPWKTLMIISLVLAFLSSILALVTPNKLSDFADLIGEGLVIRYENIELISKEMINNVSEDKLNKLFLDENISIEEKSLVKSKLEYMSTLKDEEKVYVIFSFPENVLNYLLEDMNIEKTKISISDQISMINVMSKIDIKGENKENILPLLDSLPKSIKSLIEPKMNTNKIKNVAIFMAVVYLLSAVFSYVQSLSMTTVSNKFAYKLRNSVNAKINKLPLKYFDTHENGDILSRITNDIDTIAQNLNNSLSTLVSGASLFIGSIIMMFYTNWIMALTAIIASMLGFMFMGRVLGKSQKYFAESQKALGDVNGYIEEMYSGHNVVKAYNASEASIAKFDNLNNNLYEAKRKSIFLSGTMQPMMGFIGNLGYVAVCIVGALLTMNNIISFGVIVAFMLYVRLFTNPLSQIAQAMTNLQSTAAASERVFEFIDEKEMTDEKDLKLFLDKNKVKGKIEFKNVKFGYDEGKTIINDFSLVAKPGEKIAIVGPTGAGKTTIVNLLMKFYEVNAGEILIDDVKVSELTRENIHDLFIMVLQDTWLFDGTVKENIKYNKKDVSDEEIWNALRVVGVDHFVKTLPGALNAKISDSEMVSLGQKQLLTIARGMIEDAPFLILDEATSNVDTRTEELVQKAMDKLTKGRTSFIIAHRLSTIKNADLILVMDGGNIKEAGTHDELIKKKGFYYDLYNAQFTNK